jgi:predicted aspartyl protease/Flp pilus assembly protein TadD
MNRRIRSRLFVGLVVLAFALVSIVRLARAQESASGNAPETAPQKEPGASAGSATAGAPALPAPVSTSAKAAAPSGPTLASAMVLYRAGKYDKAEAEYTALTMASSPSPYSYVGLARACLRQSKLAEALAAANKAIEAAPNDPHSRIVLGEVYFRLGKISEAEAEFVPIVKSGQAYARAYLGEARISWVSSYYKQAVRLIEVAHKLDSADPDITHFWVRTQISSGSVRFEAKGDKDEKGPPENGEAIRKTVEVLTGSQQERHSCHPASPTVPVELPFETLLNDPQTYRAMGLKMGINGTTATLMVDTGASGIVLGRKVAEKAGVTHVTDTSIGGIGDRGEQSGYVGHVDSIHVGGLEFRDCYVEVIERKNAIGDDGLVGADLFRDFLVDLDFSGRKFRLSALPPLPNETSDASPANSTEAPELHNRYVAPEMKAYTPVYRFGHDLLVPTKINDSVVSLFLIDSGATFNAISPAAAREVTKVASDSYTTIKGLNGKVKNVYRADQATLTFGRLRQQNQDITSFDTGAISNSIGTEVSGILGFATLGMLEVKIDYRDGLVDFAFDQQKWCKGKCR